MHDSPIGKTQRFYARLAGAMYLFNYATSVFGALTPSSIRGSGDFAEQARRVLASEVLYRTALVGFWLLFKGLRPAARISPR